ncbi:MAG: phosphocholine cytidylyltransferase family protein, partial [Patescibacteria group bacterium]
MKTAVILAAGRGTRLRQLTEKTPKCLIRVGGLPILHRQLAALEKNGITEAIVVVGFLAETVRQYVNAHFPHMKSVFVVNDRFASTNTLYSLALAAQHIPADSEVFLLNGDVVFDREIIRYLLDADPTKSYIAANRERCGEEEIKISLAEDGTIALLSKKVNPAEALGEGVGINKFSPSFWTALADNLRKLHNDFSCEYFEHA